MTLDPKRLLVLRAIAEGGGISPAARLLGHTPSAVSQQLRRLEQEAGAPLVDRTDGRLELTAAGRLLAGSGRRIEAAVAEAVEQLGAMTGRAAGPVRIGLSAWAVGEIGVSALRLLAEDHPALEPGIFEVDQSEGLRALRLGEIDVLVMADDRDTAIPLPPGVVAHAMLEAEYRLVVPEGWPVPTEPAELSGRPWIGAPEGSARARATDRFLAAHGVAVSARHAASQPTAIQALVSARRGAVILPSFTAERLRDARITRIPVSGRFLVRVLRHAGPGGPAPATGAAVRALQQAALDSAERFARSGLAEREPVQRQLRDPSEEQGK